MNRNLLDEKSRYAIIGTLMTIIVLLFLFYIGRSMVYYTKEYTMRKSIELKEH